MKNILMLALLVLFTLVSCDDDPTSPPVQPESSTVTIKSLKNNDAVYDSLFIEVETSKIDNIVKISILVDGDEIIDLLTPPYKAKIDLPYFHDNSDHNLFAKVYTTDDSKTYSSDIIYFKYYEFKIGALTMLDLTNNSVKVSWSNNISSLDHYVIESKKEGEGFVEVDQVSPNVNGYTFTGLDPNYKYTFRIKAVKDTIFSYSEELIAKNVISDIEFYDSVTEGGDSFSSIIFNEDSSYFYTANTQNFAQLLKWSTANRRVVNRININGYHSYPNIAVLEDKNILAVKTDYNIHLYDMSNGQFIKLLLFYNAEYYMKPIYIRETNRLYIYTKEYILCYDANDSFNCIDTIAANNIRVWAQNGTQIVFSHNLNSVKILDSETNSIQSSTNISISYINNLAVNTNTNEIVLTTYDYNGNIIILDLNTLQEKRRFQVNNFESAGLDLYKEYCLGISSSSLFVYNTEIETTTYKNMGNFYFNEILIDSKRNLIIGTGVGEITAYRFSYSWRDIPN